MPEDLQSKIDYYVSRETQLIAKVITVLGAFYYLVLIPIQQINARLDAIDNNFLKHIEPEMREIRQELQSQGKASAEQDKKLSEMLILLKQHDNNLNK